jgi:hypothetical protein
MSVNIMTIASRICTPCILISITKLYGVVSGSDILINFKYLVMPPESHGPRALCEMFNCHKLKALIHISIM